MCYCSASCGDLDNPPSLSNLTLCAIIELVIMLVVGILCAVDLVRLIQYMNNDHSWTYFQILKIIEYILIVSGMVLVLVGLFCCPQQGKVRSGIMCFCVGTILAVVIVVLVIVNGYQKDSLLYNICYVILLVCLAYILWRQSARL